MQSTYELETKIREIVYELAGPAMNRVQVCMDEVARLNRALDEHHHRVSRQQQQFEQLDLLQNTRANEMQACLARVARIVFLWVPFIKEADYQSRDSMRKTELEVLQGEFERLVEGNRQRDSVIDQMQGTSQRMGEELGNNAQRINELNTGMQARISEFISEQMGGYIDMREMCQRIREDIVFLKESTRQHVQFFDTLSMELHTFKAQKDSMRRNIEQLLVDVDSRVHKDSFATQMQRLDIERAAEASDMRNRFDEMHAFLESEIDRFQSELTLLRLDVNRLDSQLDEQRQAAKAMTEEYHTMVDSTAKHIEEVQAEFQRNEEVWQLTFKWEFSETLFNQSNLMQELKQTIRKDVIRMQQELEAYRANLAKQIIEEFRTRSAEFKREVSKQLSESLREQCTSEIAVAIAEFESKLESQRKQVRDVEVQVILSDPIVVQQGKAKKQVHVEEVKPIQVNYDLIQEMIERTLFELISETLQQSKVLPQQIEKVLQKNQAQFMMPVTVAVAELKQLLDAQRSSHTVLQTQVSNLAQAQKTQVRVEIRGEGEPALAGEFDQRLALMESEVQARFDQVHLQLDELRQDFDIVYQIKSELSDRIRSLSDQVHEQSLKSEKYFTQVVKIKSDCVNEQEYMLSQVNQAMRENNSLQKKCFAQQQAIAHIKDRLGLLISVALSNEIPSTPVKVQSLMDGTLFEYKPGDERTHMTYKSHRCNKIELLTTALQDLLQVDPIRRETTSSTKEVIHIDVGYQSDEKPSSPARTTTYQPSKTNSFRGEQPKPSTRTRLQSMVAAKRFAAKVHDKQDDRKLTVRRYMKQQNVIRELSLDGARSHIFPVGTPLRSPKSDFSAK